MPTHDEALLEAAEQLLERPEGQRGRLSRARVRRSVSTVYYAIFHFLLDEIGQKIIGTHGNLLARRRILARTISHKGLKTALDKVKGKAVDKSVADFALLSPRQDPPLRSSCARRASRAAGFSPVFAMRRGTNCAI
jgi:hypothetical protein